MFKNNVIATIKVNSQTLREDNQVVRIKYGSEYSIYLHNLNDRKAVVNINIDGKSVVDGGLVVNGNQAIDLKRSILNGNMEKGHAFKFIERTENIEQFRGISDNDGLVEITFQLEQEKISTFPCTLYPYNSYPYQIKGVEGRVDQLSVAVNSQLRSTLCSHSINGAIVAQANDVGITVPGSIVDQQFNQCSAPLLESQVHRIVFHLKGIVTDTVVGTKTKIQCPTCGNTKIKAAVDKFCSRCGTSVEII